MGWIPAAIGIGTAIYGAVQTRRAGSAAQTAAQREKEAADLNAKVYDWNAAMAEIMADDAINRGRFTETRFRQDVEKFIGTQRATQAASGIDVNFGSAVDVQADTAYLGELDALMIRNNAAREALGLRVEAVDLRARAHIMRKTGIAALESGRAQRSAANWAAGGMLLGAGTSLLANRYGFGNRGGGTGPRIQSSLIHL
jgi:hypothetical protein